MSEKERYATINRWAEFFEREENVQISNTAISRRLEKIGIVGVDGRLQDGKLCIAGFYREGDVRHACKDLLESVPRADDDGLFIFNDVRYGTPVSVARLLGLSPNTVGRRISESSLTPIKGKDRMGKIRDFYPELQVRELCARHLEAFPQADAQGFFTMSNVTYGTATSLGHRLGLNIKTVANRIESSSLQPVVGKSQIGKFCNFYPEPEVRHLCADLLETIPRTDDRGFIRVGNIEYGTANSIARLHDLHQRMVANRIQAANLEPAVARAGDGKFHDFYPEPEVLKLCADLIAKKSKKQ